jgi:poly(A) polymerase Pap1
MATSTDNTVGVTGPLSTALPTDAENKLTDSLIDELKKQNNFASNAEITKRYAFSHAHTLAYSLNSTVIFLVLTCLFLELR